ncbi:UNVERIFIED_CONTAM: hypothetical protein Sradi_3081900 [Sesamum radiatum]|uniref:Uncharacterized protein n=1 Tax=Sesamum radiatum TaxID=300843 RepID=A0AAW2RCI6_SESRA
MGNMTQVILIYDAASAVPIGRRPTSAARPLCEGITPGSRGDTPRPFGRGEGPATFVVGEGPSRPLQ